MLPTQELLSLELKELLLNPTDYSGRPLCKANLPLCRDNYASTVRVMRDKRIKIFLKLAVV